MTVIRRTALLPYPARQVYQLVNDIESYPQFMDGCVGATILRREADLVEAQLDLARAGIKHSFSTRNLAQPHHSIELELLEGPFEKFNGRWHFQALGDAACKVSLDLEFMLNSALLGAAAGKLFEVVTTDLVDSLGRRARQLYG